MGCDAVSQHALCLLFGGGRLTAESLYDLPGCRFVGRVCLVGWLGVVVLVCIAAVGLTQLCAHTRRPHAMHCASMSVLCWCVWLVCLCV